MKRRTLKFAVCAAVTALMLSVTACGGSDDTTTQDAAATEDAAQAGDTTGPEAESGAEPEAETESGDEAETESGVESEAGSAGAESEEAEDEAESAGTGEYTTLEDYYNDPSVKEALDDMFGSLSEEGMSASLEVKGNEFVVIIKIEDSAMIADGLGEALDAALDEQADTFKEQVKQFDDVIGEAGSCTVVMRYTDPDDNVLAEKAFQAD